MLRLPSAGPQTLSEALASFGRGLAADVRLVVIVGSGSGASAAPVRPEPVMATLPAAPGLESAMTWIRRRDLITLAVLAGDVSGAWLQAALACDLRLAADEAAISLAPEAGSSPAALGDLAARLAELVGYSRALELLLAQRLLWGRDAAEVGLVNRAVPAGELQAATDEFLTAMMSTPRQAATEVKALLASSREGRHAQVAEVATAIAVAIGEG
jgi:enoyl-CoA hydratase/carnithine racemase